MSRKTPETCFVDVLGCKVNRYDGRQIETLLEGCGLTPVRTAAEADLIVIHTCGVTADAARKSRQTIRRLQRANPAAAVLITGCAAGEELTQLDRPPASRVPAGADWLERLAAQLEAMGLPLPDTGGPIESGTFAPGRFGDQTRAFLKVQDGCDIGCSYCIIPRLRKAPRDKPIDAAVDEAARLIEAGYREIVVTGISVGLYGRTSGSTLAELLRRLIELPGIGRIRLSSLHPGELTDQLLEVWASAPNMMPHLHLSLQSGSDAVLKAMRRGYTAADYYAAVERARAVLDHPAFTTDIITGFPGESDACFEESLAFCRRVGFSRVHVFTFSPRPGTPAAAMGGRVNGAVASDRSERLRRLADQMALDYHRTFLGRPVSVLAEALQDGTGGGYSAHYVPVRFPSAQNLRGQIVTVVPTEATADGLTASALPGEGSASS